MCHVSLELTNLPDIPAEDLKEVAAQTFECVASQYQQRRVSNGLDRRLPWHRVEERYLACE